MRLLALYGVGDLGSEILELYKRCNSVSNVYKGVIFVDDGEDVQCPQGYELVDFERLVEASAENTIEVAICVGEPRVRALLANKVTNAGLSLATLIHPDVEVPENATIGEGCLIYKGSYVGPNASIGSNTLIIRGVVAHDCAIGNNCVLSAGSILSGHDNVGEQTYVAVGAMVKEGVAIGSRTIIGMGSAVFRDIEDDMIVLGNPARPVRKNEGQRVFKG